MIDKLIEKYKDKISKINPNPYLYYNHFDEIKGKAYKEILQDLEELKKNQKICVVCKNCEEKMYLSLMQREEGKRYRCSGCGKDVLVSLGVDIDE